MKKYAAVDIGSNSIRLLIVGVLKTNSVHKYRKISLVRVPIRLGQDVFLFKKISNEKLKLLLNTLKAFKLLMSVHNIDRYKICATSAMRESNNSEKVLKRVASTPRLQTLKDLSQAYKDLKELYESGALTDVEFRKEKKQVLGQ